MPKQPQSKRMIAATLFLLLGVPSSSPQERGQPVYLPNGKVLVEPPAGAFVSDLNAFPINSAISPDGRYVAFLNNGYGHSTSGFRKSIAIHDRVTGLVSDFTEPGTGLNFDGPADICTPFYGLAFSSNGKHCISRWPPHERTRNSGIALRTASGSFRLANEVCIRLGTFRFVPPMCKLPEGVRHNNPSPTPSGLSVRPDPDNPGEDLIYAALTLSDAAVELSSAFKRVNRVFDLHTNASSSRPCRPNILMQRLFRPTARHSTSVSTTAPPCRWSISASGKASHLPVGLQQTGPSSPSSHPSHMAVHPSGKAVFVAVENTDLISLIDNDPASKTYRKVAGNFDVRTPEMKDRKLWGAGPNHLTFAPGREDAVCHGWTPERRCGGSPDRGRCRQHETRSRRLPANAVVSPHDGDQPGRPDAVSHQWKGRGTGPNKPNRPFPPGQRPGVYGPLLLKGSLHTLPLKDALANLPKYTAAVKRNNQLDPESMRAARRAIDFNPIRHVIYVIKENRTYDQILGDLENTRARIKAVSISVKASRQSAQAGQRVRHSR